LADKLTTVRFVVGGDRFEILVDPDAALNYKLGKKVDLSQILAADEIYTDSNKGQKASEEKLMKSFRTSNFEQVAQMILQKGDIQLTTDQRRKMVDEKRLQIVSFISKNYVDPKTKLPHPPVRIEQALQQVRVVIDPNKDAEEQAKKIIDELRAILPLKTGNIKLKVHADAIHAPQTLGTLKSFGEIIKEEWRSDGSLDAIIEIPIATQRSLLDRLGSATKGTAQVSPVE
jgi:ribosome maturation protein SDO1